MPKAGQQEGLGRASHAPPLSGRRGWPALTRRAVSACPSTCCCSWPEKCPRELEEPPFAVTVASCGSRETCKGTLVDSAILWAFGAFLFYFFKPNTYGFYCLDGGWRQQGEREHRALKMTKHFHLWEPPEEGGNERIFLRESHLAGPA